MHHEPGVMTSLRQTPRIHFVVALACCGWVAVAWPAPASGGDFSQALSLYQTGNYSEARIRFARLAAERPNDVEINFYLGRLAWWFDDDAAAVLHLERAAQNAPRDARIQNALGDAYGLRALNVEFFAKYGWAKKCLAAHELAVHLAPDNAACRWGLMGYYCLAPVFAGGGYDKAFVQAAVIRKLDPVSGRVAFATVYLAEGRNGAAFAEFDSALRSAPDDFFTLYHIGRCAAVSGEQLDRGAAALRRCLHLTPPEGEDMPTEASVHFRLGNILEKQGDKAAARKEYDAASRVQPDFRADKIQLKN
jgi:tetratricopeptide (TPR) repeat protein